MADEYINKVSEVWAHFFAYMSELEGQSPDDGVPIEKVVQGDPAVQDYPIPFLSVQMLSSVVNRRSDEDKLWRQTVKLRIVSRSPDDDPTTEILRKIAMVENQVEAYERPEGASGFEDAAWAIKFGVSPEAGNIVMADSERSFAVKVERGDN